MGRCYSGTRAPLPTACCCKYARNLGPNLYQVGPRVGERFPFACDCKLHKQRVEACLHNTSSAQKVPKGQATSNARSRASPQPFLPTRRGTCNALPDNILLVALQIIAGDNLNLSLCTNATLRQDETPGWVCSVGVFSNTPTKRTVQLADD